MRKKNIFLKFTFIFFISLIGCNNNDAADEGGFLEKGVALFEQGEFDKARLEIKNAIKKNPGAAEPYYYLALLNEKGRKFKAMKSNLIKAIKLDPEHIKSRLKLGKVYLLFNELDDASKEVDYVLIKEPGHLDALSLNASILVRQEKFKEALAIIDGILEKDANHVDALSLKIVLLMKEEAFDEALAILSPAIQNDEKNITLHLLKTQLDSKKNDTNALIEDYEKLIEFKPDDIYIKYALAKVYIKSNKGEKAEEILRKLVQDNPDLIDAKLGLLEYLYKIDVNKATDQLNIYIEEYKNDYAVLIKFSNWLIAKKRTERALEILNTAVTQDDINQQDKATINLILSKIELSNRRFDNGLAYIEKIIKEDASNFDAKLLKAEVFFAIGNYEAASQLVEEILLQQPNMDKALSLLGNIELIHGNMDKANANFNEALKLNPANLVALKFLVARATSEEHIDYGIEILERALRLSPAKLTILIKLIELNIDEKNWDKANKYIDIIKQLKNGSLYAQYYSGRIFQRQNKNKEAVVIYKEILTNYPGLKDALVGMAESYSALNQQSKMHKYLDGVIESHPNIIYPYILKSQLLSLDKQNSKAVTLLNNAIQIHEIKHASLFIELARQYAILGKKDDEYKTYVEALNYSSGNIKVLLLLASFYEKNNELDKAVEQYDKVLQINPEQKIAKNNLASIIIDHYGKPEDIEKAVQLTETFKQSNQAYFLDTYGWAQLKNGDINKALSIFKKVVLLDPDVPVFRYHLAVAYYTQGDTFSAVSELKQALYLGKGKVIPEKVLIEELLAKIENN
jgi:tetratricopeptide (TPR) repeat protein